MFKSLPIAAQRAAYKSLTKRCEAIFAEREEGSDYVFFRICKFCKSDDNYGLSVYDGPATLGISLDGHDYSTANRPMRMVLKFATYGYESGVGRTAGLLASNPHGRIALFHSGRVYTGDGRGTPSLDRKASINGKSYFFIGYLDDVKLLSRLVAFHKSRTAQGFRPSLPKKKQTKTALDAGAGSGGLRGEVYFEARHHPLTFALKAEVVAANWAISEVSGVSPDLVVEKLGSKILFELKPTGNSHDLMMGLSQLLIYNKFVGAERLCLVASEPRKSQIATAINEFMLENNIDFLEYELDGDDYVFRDLVSVLR